MLSLGGIRVQDEFLPLAIRAGWVNFPVKDVIEARKMSGVYDLNSVPDGQARPFPKP